MLRRSALLPAKLIIVESPNKVGSVSAYASKIGDMTFGKPELAALADGQKAGREPVTVIATIGHFKRITKIDVSMKNEPPKTESNASGSSASDFAAGAKVFTFDTTWEPAQDKQSKEKEIRDLARAKGVTEVIIATDPDREGEVIGEHALQAALGISGPKAKPKKGGPQFSRAYIQSITQEGVEAALRDRTPNAYDSRLANAATSRAVLDRLFGYFGSAMIQTVSGLKSIGRVQTPALILIHDREVAHDDFLKKRATTYGLTARAVVGPADSDVACVVAVFMPEAWDKETGAPRAGAKPKKTKKSKAKAGEGEGEGGDDVDLALTWSPRTLDDAKAIASSFASATSADNADEAARAGLTWSAHLNSTKPVARETEPPQPLTLQALMLRLGKKHRMGSQDVMQACQQLFTEGHITYPRTDSVRIEAKPAEEIKRFVAEAFGKDALGTDEDIAARLAGERPAGKKGKAAKTEASNVEDAHEALRPTKPGTSGAQLGLSARSAAVYDEIRTVALQAFMRPQVQESVGCTFAAEIRDPTALPGDVPEQAMPPANSTLTCRITTTRTAQAGFMAADPDFKAGSDDALFDYLMACANGEAAPKFTLSGFKAVERKAAPPPLYFEGALIEELKKQGIGRPSTYATILSTLRERGYVNIENPSGKIRTTERGRELVSVARRFFPLLVDLKFTSRMEGSLDEIVRGKSTPDSLTSSVMQLLIGAAAEVARASYFKDAKERASNAQKAALVAQQVRPFSVQTPKSGKVSFEDYCSRVRNYLRRSVKPGTGDKK